MPYRGRDKRPVVTKKVYKPPVYNPAARVQAEYRPPVLPTPAQTVAREYRPPTMAYNPAYRAQVEYAPPPPVQAGFMNPFQRSSWSGALQAAPQPVGNPLRPSGAWNNLVNAYGAMTQNQSINMMQGVNRVLPGTYPNIPSYVQPWTNNAASRESTSPALKTKAETSRPIYRHGYKRYIEQQKVLNSKGTGIEASGTTPEIPPPYPGNGGGGGGGGGWTDWGGGGGGGSYTPYSYPFSQYQQGYALQGTQAQPAVGMRTAGQAQQYASPYATQNGAQRWLQLLTSWRI